MYFLACVITCYLGQNKANIDIDDSLKCLPTTQKAVANAIVQSGIANDINGCRYLYMDNRYACPQLLALLLTNYNVRGVGTCRAGRKGFPKNELTLDDKSDRGTFVRLVDKRLGMVATRWKDSKTLQVVSTVMKKGIDEVQRRTGSKLINVKCPNDIIMYQKNMGGVDRGDQHRVMGAGFANVSHFKKWYKKAFLGICDFALLNAFTAWNLSATSNERTRGVPKKNKLLKWEFYSVVAEELMSYVDQNDSIICPSVASIGFSENKHISAPFDKSFKFNHPTCIVCSTEEGVMRKMLDLPDRSARSFSRRKKNLAVCTHENCNIVAHLACPAESRMKQLPQFKGLSCFQIAHHPDCNNLYYNCVRNGHTYIRSSNNHPILEKIKNLYAGDVPRRSKRSNRGRPKKEGEQLESTRILRVSPPPVLEIRKRNEQDQISAVTSPDGEITSPTAPKTRSSHARRKLSTMKATMTTRASSTRSKAKRNIEYKRSTRNKKARR